MSQILFTYGTLMRNQRNHWRLLGSKFLGRAVVRGEIFQFRASHLNFPILRRNTQGLVHGELYEVSRAVLDVQDWYEMLYKRVKTAAFPEGPSNENVDDITRSCWVYEGLDSLPLRLARKLPGGVWPA